MTHTIVMIQEKGGVGKTSVGVHTASGVAVRGYRTLIIDFDPQANTTRAFGFKKTPALHDMLVREAAFKDTLKAVSPEIYAPGGRAEGQLFLLPGDIETRAIPMMVSDVWKLRKRLMQLEKAFDYIIIDTSPTPSLSHSMLLYAADYIIYPTKCETWSIEGLVESLHHTDEASETRSRHADPIVKLGIVPTMHRANTVEHDENLKLLKTHYGDLVWPAIANRTDWAEATGLYQTLFRCRAPQSKAVREAWRVVDRVLEGVG